VIAEKASFMTQPWSDHQRKAVRAFRKAISVRAQREQEIASEDQRRRQATQEDYVAQKQHVEEEGTAGQAGALGRAEKTRETVIARHAKDRQGLKEEFQAIRQQILREYKDAKAALEDEFKQARWSTATLYESDKRVAKEEYFRAQADSKELLRKQLNHWRIGRDLIDGWDFLDEIPPLDPKELKVGTDDPWALMRDCADQAAVDQMALSNITGTQFINSSLPWWILIAVWLFLSAPGFFMSIVDPGAGRIVQAFINAAVMWIICGGVIVPIGYWWINRLRNRTNDRIIALWLSLRRSVHLARKLRPVYLARAKKKYLTKKRGSYKKNREGLRVLVKHTQFRLTELRGRRESSLKKNQQVFQKRFIQQRNQQEKELRTNEDAFAKEQQDAGTRYENEKQKVETAHVQRREEDHHWHTQSWTGMLREWKSACDQFMAACRMVARETEQWFPDWSRPLGWPKTIPAGLPIGRMDWSLEQFENGVPVDVQLPRPDLSKLTPAALLPFPRQSSVLFRAQGEGKGVALDTLQAALLRCWTSMPAGKVRCTIIDAVGRGENFSAFMHLADHDEKLVDGRIWTETVQIDERLNNLTLHMENVLQKYLRNQFETLAEYNAQAGEVAEPFHFLVAAHFPVNFSEDAARRLVSLASAGARCGIFTFIVVDTRQPMPHGFDLAELERVCICLDWHKEHFVWEDDDFGSFPLELEKPPEPERFNEILRHVGEEAVRSSKVEVPFEFIMPERDAWWTANTAAGIRVPIGRFGAQGRQLLELGQGTSQHVLVAGKTGSGKSTLLHVLITQLAMFYSPREIELYLIDFKKGVEFKAYASSGLPHARVVAVESEREFGLSVLQRLDVELSKRGELYRTAGVNDLASYREYAEKNPEVPHMPRIMLIVDEFQEFFIEDDKISQESALLMDRLVRQGRAFGMHVLLGSQTIGGAYSLARSTIDQMAVRIALQCSEADAHLILSRDNTEARLLSRPGEGIYNPLHGLLEGNHLFQVVWLNDDKRDEILKEVRQRGRAVKESRIPIVFEGAIPADLTQNTLLNTLWQEPAKPKHNLRAWLGDAVAIKDPTCATFRKQSGSNLLILGQQEETAVALMVSQLVSLGAGIDPNVTDPSIHVVIGQALDAAAESLLALLAETLPIRLWPQRELGALMNHLAEEIERRGQANAPPQFLYLYGLHRLRDLRRPDDDFGYSRKGEEKNPYRLFSNILKEGPSVGIFTLLWCDTLISLQRCLDRQALREFDQRVLMQMSAGDSSSLMDSPIAAKLGPQRALFYTEDQGKIEKFRPYALPPVEWIQSLQARKPDLTAATGSS
jgi:hypothetical protein